MTVWHDWPEEKRERFRRHMRARRRRYGIPARYLAARRRGMRRFAGALLALAVTLVVLAVAGCDRCRRWHYEQVWVPPHRIYAVVGRGALIPMEQAGYFEINRVCDEVEPQR